jgi:GNAT superfamily N-acetyltransferase
MRCSPVNVHDCSGSPRGRLAPALFSSSPFLMSAKPPTAASKHLPPAAQTQLPPTLRRAVQADGAAVLGLVSTILIEFGLSSDPANTDADLADFAGHYFQAGGDFVVLVDASGAVVGSCGLFSHGNGTVEIRKMYVAQSLRGSGQGRRLLDWAITRGRELGFKRISLETNSVLRTAIALYERHGFKPDAGACHCNRCDLAYSREL